MHIFPQKWVKITLIFIPLKTRIFIFKITDYILNNAQEVP